MMTELRTTHQWSCLLGNILPGNCGDKILHPSGTNWAIYAYPLEPAGSRHTVCRQIHGKGVTESNSHDPVKGHRQAGGGVLGRTPEGVLTACSHSTGGGFLESAALPQTHLLDHQAHYMKLRGKVTASGLVPSANSYYIFRRLKTGEPLVLLSVYFYSHALFPVLAVYEASLFWIFVTFMPCLPLRCCNFLCHFDLVAPICGCRASPGSSLGFLCSFYLGLQHRLSHINSFIAYLYPPGH